MKLRTLLALACAMILSLSAVGMVLATDQTCGETEQGTTTCPSDGATPTPTATATDKHGHCGCPTPTATATDEESTSPTATATGSDEATPTPTATTETSSPSDESSPSDGGVAAETGTPSVTLPPTDSLFPFTFFLQGDPVTGGRTPLEALRAGDLAAVLTAVDGFRG